jgi:hypothetical protein
MIKKMSFTNTTPIRRRIASENEVRERSSTGRTAATSTPPRSASVSSSKQMYTTEFIKALFGDSGVVVGDFSCSYQRQAGRLYVSTDAVFFYSNLFGFEKRVKIDYKHVLEIDFIRSTSVFIKTSNEEFVFRSFEDRDSVLELIKAFFSKISSSPTLSADIKSTSHSVPHDTRNDDLTSLSEHDNEAKQQRNSHVSLEDSNTHTSKTGGIVESLDGKFLWEKMKKHSTDWEALISTAKLPCNSVTDFFNIFLRDSAKRSTSYFQSKIMNDTNVVVEAWTKNSAPDGEGSVVDSLSRMIEFEHATRWAIAKVKRRQTYQMCGRNAIIQNFTHLQGIPQADAFFVEDMWLLEDTGSHVTLNVKFRIVWLKNTMLKSVITNRTRTEAKEWFDKFIPFVSQKPDQESSPVQDETTASNRFGSLFSFLFGLCHESPAFVLLIILSLYTYHLKQRLLLLEDLVDEIQMKMNQLEVISVGETPYMLS